MAKQYEAHGKCAYIRGTGVVPASVPSQYTTEVPGIGVCQQNPSL
ncbi:hypothetical protein [Paenibacillus sonchi]|nr:hypothetical protein [Paenibacillus sonchi]